MIQTIYIENNVRDHPRVQSILNKYSKSRLVSIERYTDVFNNHAQNFRLQKLNPTLILAKKHGRYVLPTPPGFGIGGTLNYYFAHMMNCIYDCRYCFLQGMYSSANYVLFVNFEDFESEIEHLIRIHPKDKITFFSGYDCDSLALENISGFVSHILPVFQNQESAVLELRTKSVQIRPLDTIQPINNCVVAFSMMPAVMSQALDHGTPSIPRRLTVIKKLAKMGWKIGLRFDPLIYGENWKPHYQYLFEKVFRTIPISSIHSVSYGPLRFPKSMYKRISKLYPEEKLLASSLSETNRTISYRSEIELEMTNFCKEQFARFISKDFIFQCTTEAQTMRKTG